MILKKLTMNIPKTSPLSTELLYFDASKASLKFFAPHSLQSFTISMWPPSAAAAIIWSKIVATYSLQSSQFRRYHHQPHATYITSFILSLAVISRFKISNKLISLYPQQWPQPTAKSKAVRISDFYSRARGGVGGLSYANLCWWGHNFSSTLKAAFFSETFTVLR